MGLFGKSFGEKVRDAVAVINKSGLGVRDLRAKIDGKVVTLEGQAESLDAKGRIMLEFNKMVATENTVNKIQVQGASVAPPIPGPGPLPAGEATVYEVKPGDTLGAIAQRFYGKASLYPKIFEANRDILTNPDLIKIGQKLKIPKL
ncbi:MAG TPA: LysM peptidoglycan-binding domain-containing protein [Candidatus Desulfaltia sp.]|nr:LysM peptidoglycan-binding domain-containing protein [Candidatus Desulfaltia sp.]